MDSFSNLVDVHDGEMIEASHENAQSAAVNRLEAVLTINPPKAPVRLATATSLGASTLVSDVLAAVSDGPLSIDGEVPSIGDRVLVKDEGGTDAYKNGIYVVSDLGSVSTAWRLTRADDLRVSSAAPGAVVYVSEGAINSGSQWASTADSAFVLNSSSLLFEVLADLTPKAPVASPSLTGTPTAPTASQGDNSGRIATTAYVDTGLASRAPVSGIDQSAITDLVSDLAAKAPLASPALTGTPTAPTATQGDNSSLIATTSYVDMGLASRAPSSGIAQSAITDLVADLDGKASLASPALTGVPTAPTAAAGTNSTQIATTAYVDSGLAGKAPLASPGLTGTPTAPTAAPGDNSTRIATTAYADAGLATRAPSSGIAQSAVTDLVSDLSGKAPLASPGLTGIPTAPTASAGTNSTQIATTAYVDAGLSTRAPGSGIAQSAITGLVSELAAKAPLASPGLTGTPTAPTAAQGDNSTRIATTAYVDSGLSTRAPSSSIAQSAVTNLVSDLAAKAPLASPGLTGTPTAPTAPQGDNSTTIATTAYVDTGLASRAPASGIAQSSVTNLVSDLGAKAALNSPALTGTPTAPTASPGTNSTQVATTAYADALLPVGTILPYAGSVAPTGFVLCDGAAYNRTGTYGNLFSVVGTTFGIGNGSTTFNVPDLRGRFPLGAGTGTGLTARTRGTNYGAEKMTLIQTDIPAHAHSIGGSTGSDTSHTHSLTGLSTGNDTPLHAHASSNGATFLTGTGAGNNVASGSGGAVWSQATYTSTPTANHTHPLSGSTAAGTAHSHSLPASTQNSAAATTQPTMIPPSLAINFIIRA